MLNDFLSVLFLAAVYSLLLVILMARRNPIKHFKGWFGMTVLCTAFYYIASAIIGN